MSRIHGANLGALQIGKAQSSLAPQDRRRFDNISYL